MSNYPLRGIVIAAGLAFAASAQAADLPPLDLPAVKAPPYMQEFFSPWYARADVGYRMSSLSDGVSSLGPVTGGAIDDLATIGGGVGIKWNWARADVTVDYGMEPKLSGTAGGVLFNEKLQNITTLLNGYFDLGTWWGFTPYVGAGAGYTYFKPSGFTQGGLVTATTENSWEFSWAVMAGASFTVSRNLLLDVGYRYLDLGETETTLPAGKMNFGEWTAQEVRVGFRYMIP